MIYSEGDIFIYNNVKYMAYRRLREGSCNSCDIIKYNRGCYFFWENSNGCTDKNNINLMFKRVDIIKMIAVLEKEIL